MSSWLQHVKNTKAAHPDKLLKDVLKMASQTYKKGEGVAENVVKRSSRMAKRGIRAMKKTAKRGSRMAKYAVTGKKNKRMRRKTRRNK